MRRAFLHIELGDTLEGPEYGYENSLFKGPTMQIALTSPLILVFLGCHSSGIEETRRRTVLELEYWTNRQR